MATGEIRAIVNQCGVAMELHRVGQQPATLTLVSMQEVGLFREQLAETNPSMRYATGGQLAVGIARAMYGDAAKANGVAISSYAWVYNASDDEYSRA